MKWSWKDVSSIWCTTWRSAATGIPFSCRSTGRTVTPARGASAASSGTTGRVMCSQLRRRAYPARVSHCAWRASSANGLSSRRVAVTPRRRAIATAVRSAQR
ncbi:Uncharacterised protein [Mycobacteroides abscessus]|nr:Uncharacterised protein [Mycobacteroides abscessus]